MERDANYVAVGAFVALVLAMATVFVLWYTNARDRREYQRYEVYFQGSVFGLNEGSTVRYLGVNVGRVERIEIDPRAADRVRVLVDLVEDTPVETDTVARLSLQGVTGLLFIDLAKHAPGAALGPDVPSLRHPVIRSEPSNFDRFLSGLPDLVTEARTTIQRLNVVLDEKNLAHLERTLENIRAATEPLPEASREAMKLFAELRAATVEARNVAAATSRLLDQAGPDVGAAAARLRESSENLARLTGRIDAILAAGEPDLERFAGQGLGDLQQLVRESRDAVTEVRDLARALRDEPSQLIWQQPPPGVEIPR